MDATPPDSVPPRYVAAFRTHQWSPAIATMAARLEAHCPHGRFVVVADETNGVLNVGPYEKLSHTVDFSGLGLPLTPADNTLWHCGDYALYLLLHALPRYDYYLLSEYDVAVNADLDGLVAAAARQGLDLVAPWLRPTTERWYWYRGIAPHVEDPWGILFAVVLVSRRALERLYVERRRLGEAFRRGEFTDWPYCEAFVPSILCGREDMACADLADFVRLGPFTNLPAMLLDPAVHLVPGTLSHPVLGREEYVARQISLHRPADFLFQGSDLRRALAGFDDREVVPQLRRALGRDADPVALDGVRALARGEAWAHPWEVARAAADLARGRPALQSSLAGPWSRGGTPEEDAGFVVAGELAEECAQHTDQEDDPWWQVDLGGIHAVAEVELLNRYTLVLRSWMNELRILGSRDGEEWRVLHHRAAGAAVSGDAARPERILLPEAPEARFIRLQLVGRTILSMRRVRVFGRPATSPATAAQVQHDPEICHADVPSEWTRAVPSYVAAFRTHLWDPTVAGMAARMEAHAPGGRFVVLADETAGRLNVAPYEKIAHSVDMSGIGLPTEPAVNTLWFSGDHALYVLLHALPRHDYYVVSEYDVQVNTNLDALVAIAGQRDLDLVAPGLRRPAPDWPWYHNAIHHFGDPWAILFAVIVVSRRALERLYAERLEHAARLRAGHDAAWAHCEGFVPSVLAATQGMAMADLGEFVRLPRFTWDRLLEAGTPELDEPGTMAHPVLGRDRIIARRLGQFPPADYLNPVSHLRTLLSPYSFAEVLPHLRQALAREGNAEGVARLLGELRGEAWVSADEAIRAATDIARGKPCSQSSIAPPWSRGATVEEDAGYVVAPELLPDCAHHTNTDDEPWWQVDLGAPHVVREVEVLNRSLEGVQERLNAYFLLGSLDGENWFCLHFRPFGLPVSGNPERPERIGLEHGPVTRFVRVQLPERGLLNMRRVRVWGDPAPAEAAEAG